MCGSDSFKRRLLSATDSQLLEIVSLFILNAIHGSTTRSYVSSPCSPPFSFLLSTKNTIDLYNHVLRLQLAIEGSAILDQILLLAAVETEKEDEEQGGKIVEIQVVEGNSGRAFASGWVLVDFVKISWSDDKGGDVLINFISNEWLIGMPSLKNW